MFVKLHCFFRELFRGCLTFDTLAYLEPGFLSQIILCLSFFSNTSHLKLWIKKVVYATNYLFCYATDVHEKAQLVSGFHNCNCHCWPWPSLKKLNPCQGFKTVTANKEIYIFLCLETTPFMFFYGTTARLQ